jgi:DNA-binding CsgD family transcriptional regulator
MPRLTSDEINALMGAVGDIHACRDAANLARVAVEAMTRVIPTDRADFQIYRNAPQSFETLHRYSPLPGDAEREALYQDIMVEHPVVAHVLATGDEGPFILSDFISTRNWRQTRFWAECCREPGDNHLLCNAVSVEPGVQLSLSFSRRLTDFNEHHRMMLRLAQKHIAQAWENARHFEWLEYGMEAEGRAIVVLGPDSRIQVAGRRAMVLLRRYFPDWRGSRLPARLAEWLANERRKTRADAGLAVPTSYDLTQGRRSLNVRLLRACEQTAAPEILSLEERDPAEDMARLQALGLTPRQAQVLYWMMQGRSNPDIAALLAVRPRTVDKFAEAVFRRLGVDNRLAASLRARDALNETLYTSL